jgi:hypothetical protein
VRRQHTIAQAFVQAAAMTAGTARSASRLGLKPGMAWHHLVGQAVLRCPGDGRYFLDLPNWHRMRRRRQCIAVAIIVAFLAVSALACWMASWQ